MPCWSCPQARSWPITFKTDLDLLAPLGMDHGIPLMLTSNGLTAVLTNLMADGPAAAAVGPITLNMASIVHPGTTFLPFMAMATAVASSFASQHTLLG